MKNFQLPIVAFVLLCVIQSMAATPAAAEATKLEADNLKVLESGVTNCTAVSKNGSELEELGNDEDLEDPEPSEEFKAEIQEHLKQAKVKALDNIREKRHAGAIYHGNKIALQSCTRYNWLGCAYHCGTYSCPGMYFEGTDWTRRCGGEVFRIYRMNGPGYVRVGDYVGMYFPAQNRWLGCPHVRPYCGKYDCPGSPRWRYGFSSRSKWHICGGEVFRIYARNKAPNSVIYEYDDIMLYFVAGKKWLSLNGLTNALAKPKPCPGLILPPHPKKYDDCWSEVFRINKQ